MADAEFVPMRQNSTLNFDNISGGSSRTFIAGNHPNSVVTAEGITLVVIKGNACDQMVDVLACSVGGSYNLSEGAIAKSILQRAGSQIQDELTNVKPNQPRYGDVVATQGYRLNASVVLHGVLKKWNNGRDDAEKVLRIFITNVLNEADRRRLRKVAIPAVGCGALGFPGDVVAKALFEVSDNFSRQHSNTSVTEIRLVVYDKDITTFNAFASIMSRLQAGKSLSSSASSGRLGSARPAAAAAAFADSDSDDSPTVDSSDDDNPSQLLHKLIHGLRVKAKEKETKIQRMGITPPLKWGPPDPADPYRRVTLSPSDIEYKAVVQNVKKTGSFGSIIRIERIENHNLWNLYMMTHENMVQMNGRSIQNEQLLWHGTAVDALTNIYAGGFNRSYCGKNATAYGKGVYFAKDFSYSAQPTYSPPDPKTRNRYIFQCRVLTGQYTNGTPDMIEPPIRSGKLRYDSVTNDVHNPILWVVFKDTHAYPEYLVVFQ